MSKTRNIISDSGSENPSWKNIKSDGGISAVENKIYAEQQDKIFDAGLAGRPSSFSRTMQDATIAYLAAYGQDIGDVTGEIPNARRQSGADVTIEGSIAKPGGEDIGLLRGMNDDRIDICFTSNFQSMLKSNSIAYEYCLPGNGQITEHADADPASRRLVEKSLRFGIIESDNSFKVVIGSQNSIDALDDPSLRAKTLDTVTDMMRDDGRLIIAQAVQAANAYVATRSQPAKGNQLKTGAGTGHPAAEANANPGYSEAEKKFYKEGLRESGKAAEIFEQANKIDREWAGSLEGDTGIEY